VNHILLLDVQERRKQQVGFTKGIQKIEMKKLITSLCLVLVTSLAMAQQYQFCNLTTQTGMNSLPVAPVTLPDGRQIPSGVNVPMWAQLAMSNRVVTALQPAPSGMVADTWAYVDNGDGTNAMQVASSWHDPVAAAIAASNAAVAAQAVAYSNRVASIPSALWQVAGAYQKTMRGYFGAGAETNTAVTFPTVQGFFLGVQQGLIPVADKGQASLDSQALQAGFTAISAWTGDGTAWTFPYNLIPTNSL
jgi:hypothetical protein